MRPLLMLRARPRSLDYAKSYFRCFSHDTSSHSTDEESSTNTSSSKDDKTVFPWRHDDKLLPRLVPGTLEHTTQGHLLSSTNTPLGNATLNAVTTAYMFLDVPIWQLFLFPIWKAELADSMSWAFTQGVSNLLCKLTNVPPSNETAAIGDDDDDKSNYEIKFQTKISQDPEKDVTEENGRNSLDGLKVMMDEKLLSLYNTSLLKDGTEILLQSRPYSAELLSLYCIPYISRSNIKNDTSLHEFYRNMLEKRAIDRSPDLAKLRKDYLETGMMESTVIAQILVWCNEKFYVKDGTSGFLLQGQEDTDDRQVPHLVRMEMTVKTEKNGTNGSFRNTLDNWIITDIDDMMEGNLVI